MGKKVSVPKPPAELEPQACSLRWEAIREDYIAQNLAREKGQPAYNYKMLAEAHHVSYIYLRQVAGKQKWNLLLKQRMEERSRQLATHLQGVSLFDEIEIRTRQASYARLASSLAYQKLQSLKTKDVAKLTIKDAIELMKLGLTEERTALGIKDSTEPPLAPEQRVLSNSQVFAVARRVIELQQSMDGGDGPDAAN